MSEPPLTNFENLKITCLTSQGLVSLFYGRGRSTKFWTLYIGILYGPVPTSTAIHSSIFVGPFHMRVLYTESYPSYTPV